MPALTTTGKSLKDIGLQEYEIALTEPLHDLKNVILHIFEGLQSICYQNKALGKMVIKFSRNTLGKPKN